MTSIHPHRFLLLTVFALLALSCQLFSTTQPAVTAEPTVDYTIRDQPAEESTATLPPTIPAVAAAPQTYYVRSNGGSFSECTGLADAPYPGSGSGQACAWNHPFQALPPGGSARLAGGDTLIIALGEYRMGYGAPDPNDYCEAGGAFDCFMSPIPSGPDPEHPTRIVGAGWDQGCPVKPQLWGTERANWILNLIGTSNAEIACLEITDHSPCVEFHSGGMACERDQVPFGNWAPVGLYAQDSANVHLWNLNIHGLANTGVHAGRLTNWTVDDVRIAANGSAGWDGDLWDGDDDSNSGTLLFRRWLVEWNGCAETYPDGQPIGCWAQTAGGYGDGVGTGATGGDWIIQDSAFLHNTSDGLDLLYHTLGGTIILERVRAEGNAGNQVKVAGQSEIWNSVLVGNCAFFEGQPFTFNVDACRAAGATVELAYTGGEQMWISNSTLTGQGDGLVGAGPRGDGLNCNGNETLTGLNNIFLGGPDFFDPEDITFLFYQEECGNLRFDLDYSLAFGVKNYEAEYVNPPFPSANNLLQDPLLCGPFSGLVYGMQLLTGSPAIDSGSPNHCPSVDFLGVTRPQDGNGDGSAVCDRGAYEYLLLRGSTYLPLVQR